MMTKPPRSMNARRASASPSETATSPVSARKIAFSGLSAGSVARSVTLSAPARTHPSGSVIWSPAIHTAIRRSITRGCCWSRSSPAAMIACSGVPMQSLMLRPPKVWPKASGPGGPGGPGIPAGPAGPAGPRAPRWYSAPGLMRAALGAADNHMSLVCAPKTPS